MPIEPPVREKIAVLIPTRLPLEIDECAARVALVDCSVRLNEVFERIDTQIRASRSAETMPIVTVWPTSNRWRMAVDVAYLQRVRAPESDRGQVARYDLQHREVAFRVSADQLGLELAPVRQRHCDLIGGLYDMVVGQHEPVAGGDHTGAKAGYAIAAARASPNRYR